MSASEMMTVSVAGSRTRTKAAPIPPQTLSGVFYARVELTPFEEDFSAYFSAAGGGGSAGGRGGAVWASSGMSLGADVTPQRFRQLQAAPTLSAESFFQSPPASVGSHHRTPSAPAAAHTFATVVKSLQRAKAEGGEGGDVRSPLLFSPSPRAFAATPTARRSATKGRAASSSAASAVKVKTEGGRASVGLAALSPSRSLFESTAAEKRRSRSVAQQHSIADGISLSRHESSLLIAAAVSPAPRRGTGSKKRARNQSESVAAHGKAKEPQGGNAPSSIRDPFAESFAAADSAAADDGGDDSAPKTAPPAVHELEAEWEKDARGNASAASITRPPCVDVDAAATPAGISVERRGVGVARTARQKAAILDALKAALCADEPIDPIVTAAASPVERRDRGKGLDAATPTANRHGVHSSPSSSSAAAPFASPLPRRNRNDAADNKRSKNINSGDDADGEEGKEEVMEPLLPLYKSAGRRETVDRALGLRGARRERAAVLPTVPSAIEPLSRPFYFLPPAASAVVLSGPPRQPTVRCPHSYYGLADRDVAAERRTEAAQKEQRRLQRLAKATERRNFLTQKVDDSPAAAITSSSVNSSSAVVEVVCADGFAKEKDADDDEDDSPMSSALCTVSDPYLRAALRRANIPAVGEEALLFGETETAQESFPSATIPPTTSLPLSSNGGPSSSPPPLTHEHHMCVANENVDNIRIVSAASCSHRRSPSPAPSAPLLPALAFHPQPLEGCVITYYYGADLLDYEGVKAVSRQTVLFEAVEAAEAALADCDVKAAALSAGYDAKDGGGGGVAGEVTQSPRRKLSVAEAVRERAVIAAERQRLTDHIGDLLAEAEALWGASDALRSNHERAAFNIAAAAFYYGGAYISNSGNAIEEGAVGMCDGSFGKDMGSYALNTVVTTSATAGRIATLIGSWAAAVTRMVGEELSAPSNGNSGSRKCDVASHQLEVPFEGELVEAVDGEEFKETQVSSDVPTVVAPALSSPATSPMGSRRRRRRHHTKAEALRFGSGGSGGCLADMAALFERSLAASLSTNHMVANGAECPASAIAAATPFELTLVAQWQRFLWGTAARIVVAELQKESCNDYVSTWSTLLEVLDEALVMGSAGRGGDGCVGGSGSLPPPVIITVESFQQCLDLGLSPLRFLFGATSVAAAAISNQTLVCHADPTIIAGNCIDAAGTVALLAAELRLLFASKKATNIQQLQSSSQIPTSLNFTSPQRRGGNIGMGCLSPSSDASASPSRQRRKRFRGEGPAISNTIGNSTIVVKKEVCSDDDEVEGIAEACGGASSFESPRSVGQQQGFGQGLPLSDSVPRGERPQRLFFEGDTLPTANVIGEVAHHESEIMVGAADETSICEGVHTDVDVLSSSTFSSVTCVVSDEALADVGDEAAPTAADGFSPRRRHRGRRPRNSGSRSPLQQLAFPEALVAPPTIIGASFTASTASERRITFQPLPADE